MSLSKHTDKKHKQTYLESFYKVKKISLEIVLSQSTGFSYFHFLMMQNI